MECNICDSREFTNMKKRINAKCAACGSLERTRVMKLFIDKYAPPRKTDHVLHMAPERGLVNFIAKTVKKQNYVLSDLSETILTRDNWRKIATPKIIDLCNDLENIPDESYDLILHSHVLEHVNCNYTYVLFHLHRILKRTGNIICCIPFMAGWQDYCTTPTLSDEERTKRFGQFDHMSRFGREDSDMNLGKVINLPVNSYDLTQIFPEEDLVRYNIPERTWRGLSPDTILHFRRDDFLLSLPNATASRKPLWRRLLRQ